MFRLLLSCVIILPDFNGLTGSIPSEIGFLTKIAELILSKLLEKFAINPIIACRTQFLGDSHFLFAFQTTIVFQGRFLRH
jgi:hypothetical protein